MQDILESFEFHNQIPRLANADALGALIEKLTSPDVNLTEADSLFPDFILREPEAEYVTKPRIYVDTSVFGGCEDGVFRKDSLRLFDAFHSGEATLVFSEVTRRELETAPAAVRKVAEHIPEANFETVPESVEASKLAEAYIKSGAVGPKHDKDALHVAMATIAGVDVIASWNFKHMVSWGRIQAYNRVNRRLGHPEIDIRLPGEIYHDEQSD